MESTTSERLFEHTPRPALTLHLKRADYLTPESINIQVTQEFDGDGDVNWGGCGKDSSQKQAPSKNAIGGRKGFYSISVKSHQIWKISGWRGPSAGELAQS